MFNFITNLFLKERLPLMPGKYYQCWCYGAPFIILITKCQKTARGRYYFEGIVRGKIRKFTGFTKPDIEMYFTLLKNDKI